MNIKDLYDHRRAKVMRESGIPEAEFLEKESLLMPLYCSDEINNTELKTYYFTKAQIALIENLAYMNFKKQSEFLREIVTAGLAASIVNTPMDEREKKKYSKMLDDFVAQDLAKIAK